ncbi:MAG: DUF4384 domain-containing protein [Hydrogenophaga sp.]|uniref:DUF4384 domain-containing protein n=1 Tax=Hydrogenophaga sp. TaxID=1904254 RepID=UPI0025BCC5EE|nr:DUF4384 domain-containing protein [Hydrogenophaga sp.]MCG2657100.1 DUF4384 domain-containing protein [Hydrogenophaga sp.]
MDILHIGTRALHQPGRRLIASLLATALLMSGCSTPMDARKDASYQSHAHALDRPATRPVRSLSSFSDSLMCMDRLFRDAQIPTTLITSKQIPDFSGRVPVATKDMIITAISQMSRLSNAFRYVDFEVDIARQDTVQNLTTILLNNNQIRLQRPALYVSGAVAFVDQNVINNRFDVGTSASRLETGYSRDKSATIIGMELHLGDFRSRTLIPGLDSANEVIVGSGGQGLDLAGRIGDYGWQFNVGRDYTQGSGAAVRTLVELAMIELAGKWARVPYWQCLTLEQNHPDFQRQLRDWHDEGATAVQQALVMKSLRSGGYLTTETVKLPVNHPTVRAAIAKYQADQGMVVTGVVDFMTYERALRNYVTLGDKGQLLRVGWNTGNTEPAIPSVADGQVTAAPTGPALGAEADPLHLNLQIKNLVADKTVFEQGTQIFLSATVSRASHLYCYMQASNGGMVRLLPNATNPSSLVSANQTVRIPDWMVPSPGFVLDAGQPGEEAVMCFATGEDVLPRLPENMQAPGLAVIAGMSGMDSVEAAFSQATEGGIPVAKQRMQWRVTPKRVVPVAAPAPAPAPASAAAAKR